MKVDYILTARGVAGLVGIDVVVTKARNDEEAKRSAQRIAASLDKAGYHIFSLYRVDGEEYLLIGSLIVTHRDPTVIIR